LGGAMDEKTLGKKLQLARKRAGLTQQELCQKAGLSYSTLAKIERGAIKAPSVFTVARIASATGIVLEDLLDLQSRGMGPPAPIDTKKRSKTGVRFVYFDVNGTLVHFFHRAFTQIAHDSNQPVDMVEALFWRRNDLVSTGQMSIEEFNDLLGKEVGLVDFDWHKYYMTSIEVIPGINPLLDWVAQHYDVGLLSNNMPGFIDELLQKKLVPNIDYKVRVDSSKVGAVKPQPKIYEVATQLASVEPNEILLVDNERAYLTAADRVGWQVVWFDELQPEESINRVKDALAF
jgi:FMN phosphatase YigB (HAD superfamily)/transcriptional regulator with XRE-family HTH domain